MIIAFIAGVIFAVLACYVRLNSFSYILSSVIKKNKEVLQILLYAISVSSIIFYFENLLGFASINIKPFFLIGTCLGGILFGIGAALLGYCPGTMLMAIAEGKIDAVLGYIGGILASAFYVVFYQNFIAFIGPNLGLLNLYVNNNHFFTGLVVVLYSFFLFFLAVISQNS